MKYRGKSATLRYLKRMYAAGCMSKETYRRHVRDVRNWRAQA